MNKQAFSCTLGLATALVEMTGCNPVGTKDPAIRPNIIYILADDLGYGDLSSLNPGSAIPTPNLDKIVRNGVHFTDAHSGSSVCTPTRYGILTGRYAFRTRLKEGVTWGYSPSLIDPGRLTVASFLTDLGYTTACVGKWHLGLEWGRKDPTKEVPDMPGTFKYPEGYEDNVDYAKPVKGGPSDHGFDYSFIIPASLDMPPYCYIRNGRVMEEPAGFTPGKSQDVDGRGVFWRQGKVSPDFDFDGVTPLLVDTACRFIRDHAAQKDPFFMYLALPSPHTPWLPGQKYEGVSHAGKYGDFVAMVDDMIGKILKAVHDNNLEEKTLIIFSSDNGGDWRPEDIEQTGHLSNYIFKGRKADIYEGGHRIPYLAQWPGVIPAGIRSDEVLCTTDLLATLAGMLDASLPETAGEDSYNLWPAYMGKISDSSIRYATIHHSSLGYFAIRKGDWKFTPHLGSGGNTHPKHWTAGENEPEGTLHNLADDVQEQNNLYHQYPQLVNELSLLLEEIKKGNSGQ